MGLFSRHKPKIKVQITKRDGFGGWIKCTHCSEMLHANDLEQNRNCCPKCDYHYRLSALQRIELLIDAGSFKELFSDVCSTDPLGFVDHTSYKTRLEEARKKSGHDEAVIVGVGTLGGLPLALGVMDFNFMAGSMGSVVGERLTRLIEYAMIHQVPVIIVSASGGARMQESTLSLMQMAKVSAALGKLHEAGLLYISVLTNPTTGGVTASFASLGDIILAEPHALIGFAGPRVVEQIIKQKLPPGAQQSEFLKEHGLVDLIISRHLLKDKLAELLTFFFPRPVEDLSVKKEAEGRLSLKLQELLALKEEDIEKC